MKRLLITLAVASGLAFTSLASVNAQAEEGGKGRRGHCGNDRGNPMEHMTKELNLTPDQEAKVQPIIDQAKPQMMAIHQEAMQKANAVMDKTMDQIRPLLTPEQQQKLDTKKQTHDQKRAKRQR